MTMRQTPLRARAGAHCRRHGPRALCVRFDFQHHDDEQEQHHDGPGINDHFQHRQEGRPQEIEQQGRADKRQHQVNDGVHQVAARDGQSGGGDNDRPQQVKHDGVDAHGMVLVTAIRLIKAALSVLVGRPSLAAISVAGGDARPCRRPAPPGYFPRE